MGFAPQYKEAGGGPATGLAGDFISFLQNGLNTGSFGGASALQRFNGADPVGATGGIANILNDILSGGAGKLGGSLQELISKDVDRQAGALRARFGAEGGTAFGTPAAYAEGLLRSESAPKLAQAVGGLQLGAINPLMQIIAGLSSKGISQREGYVTPGAGTSIVGSLAPLLGAGLAAFTGNPLAAAAAGTPGGFSVPNIPMPQTPDLFGATNPFGAFSRPSSSSSLFQSGLMPYQASPPRIPWAMY